VSAISAAPRRINLAAGYRWNPPFALTSPDLKALETLLAGPGSQDSNNRWDDRYIIFSDDERTIHSTVVYTNLNQKGAVAKFKRIQAPETR
jgi:hypothetical protein